MTEDITGCAYWLHRGRKTGHTQGRGARKGGNNAEWTIESADGNQELAEPHFTEDWVRPEETDYARLVALQAYMLNASSSTAPHHRDSCYVVATDSHLAKNANTVTMPAKTYAIGTSPREVVEDCATTAGKDYGVVRHHAPSADVTDWSLHDAALTCDGDDAELIACTRRPAECATRPIDTSGSTPRRGRCTGADEQRPTGCWRTACDWMGPRQLQHAWYRRPIGSGAPGSRSRRAWSRRPTGIVSGTFAWPSPSLHRRAPAARCGSSGTVGASSSTVWRDRLARHGSPVSTATVRPGPAAPLLIAVVIGTGRARHHDACRRPECEGHA